MENPTMEMSTPSFFKQLSVFDVFFAMCLCMGAFYTLTQFHGFMDVYEKGILVLTVPTMAWLGWFWKPMRSLILGLVVICLFAIYLYAGDSASAESKFFLKYLISSQSAILWMCTLFFLSTLAYWGGLVRRSDFGASIGSMLCWAAVVMGFTGMLMRWFESYLKGVEYGHIPVSNLYEVFILFALITALFYLYYEGVYQTKQLGAFVLLVISAAVAFLIWYMTTRDVAKIQGLLPALQSWWMKIHVPANFIGYGTFSLAAMVAWIFLLKHEKIRTLWIGLVLTPVACLAFAWGVALLAGAADTTVAGLVKASQLVAVLVVIFSFTIFKRDLIIERMPSSDVLDDVMYKAISVGFIFFTIATILGALWAAEAWGGYWSWDPKETWALIVWLNYAAWLHLRLMKGLRGQLAAWWALVGLLITTFAFLGVNMFLSGLHSYGAL